MVCALLISTKRKGFPSVVESSRRTLMRSEVEDALISIETLHRELIAQGQRSVAAINAEYLSGERYDKGQTSYLEVLESQRQSFDAQLSYSQTKGYLMNSYVALYKALGGGWLSPEEEAAFIKARQEAEAEAAAEAAKKNQ